MIAEFQIDVKQRLGIFVAEINVFGTDFDFVLGSETFIFNTYGQRKMRKGERRRMHFAAARELFSFLRGRRMVGW